MQSHPVRGEEICRQVEAFRPVLPVIRYHHERWDGSGYPDGLAGRQIPLLARIVQIADIYDALTNTRSYKPAYTPAQALSIIEDETARGWRDPDLVEAFLRMHAEVIRKVSEYTATADRGLLSLRQALNRLQDMAV